MRTIEQIEADLADAEAADDVAFKAWQAPWKAWKAAQMRVDVLRAELAAARAPWEASQKRVDALREELYKAQEAQL